MNRTIKAVGVAAMDGKDGRVYEVMIQPGKSWRLDFGWFLHPFMLAIFRATWGSWLRIIAC